LHVGNIEMPRIDENREELLAWVRDGGGEASVDINSSLEGWSISSPRNASASSTFLKIPKALCIYSDPAKMTAGILSDNGGALMSSLHPSLWRVRLAVALISERAKASESHFRPYIENMPLEHWGHPLFYTPDEFR